MIYCRYSYKGKVVTYIKIGDAAYVNTKYDSWQIVFFGHYNYENEELFDKYTEKIAWSKIRFCECCTNKYMSEKQQRRKQGV